jgi:type I restriction enzyme M protein
MLDPLTKRRIDTCRDILVGKIPDPKSQVEQITIALIYKFMDDMDLESEELGGQRKFFTGEFERYAWARLVAPGTSGQDMLNTYSEALTRMPENAGLPPLFRDIFRNAYLPYRDPETLRSFLREIDGFTYDHSERLGDAFEYLLSVLGSQGDAGQFRTPRHIIDFMVEIIAPKKNEVILDPACGTAGFLISSYKHILKANTREAGGGNGSGSEESAAERAIESPLRFKGDLLSPEDRQRLATNIKGYDISPDMVRLSLVNLYLHGFANPQVDEYDTLTSEDKWNEMADVILANPPFMSPKGGVPLHRRFAIQSKRSEVLFVDYIAEHLTPQGRAAIIVPEGIIFQSQSAYCELRKMLVDNYLVAVISLPAGVFNPYSGVKTSILLLDRSIARVCDWIAFFKIENDGFNLGAQRRPVKGGQLSQVQAELAEWLSAMRRTEDTKLESALGLAVEKARIAETGEYNLSGERYRPGLASASSFPLVSLGDEALFKVEGGGTPKSDVLEFWDGNIPWATLVDLPQDNFITELTETKRTVSKEGLCQSSAKLIPANSVMVSTRATIGRVAINRVALATNQGFKNIVIKDGNRAIPEYVALVVTHLVPTMKAWATGGTFAEISKSKFSELKIPLPPIAIQREIVAEVEGYQKVVSGARAVVESYNSSIPHDPTWPMVEIGTFTFLAGKITTEVDPLKPYFGGDSFEANTGRLLKIETAETQRVNGPVYQFCGKRLLYSKIRPYLNKLSVVDVDGYCSSDVYPLIVDEATADLNYLAVNMLSDRFQDSIRGFYERASIPKINRSQLFGTKIPLPPLEIQHVIVAEIQAEQALVNGNRELITRFERKIETAIARVWGEAKAV